MSQECLMSGCQRKFSMENCVKESAHKVAKRNATKTPLKAKFQCHPARCLLPVEIMQRCGLATGPATVELLPYLLPY